jgi:hypothetical protein
MKLRNFTYIIFSALLLSGCQRQDPQSKELVTYLQEKHHLTVNDSTMYVFFPANQCKNCFLYDAVFVRSEINEHTVIITGFDNSNFKGFKHVLHDGDNGMLQLQALDYGNRIITFEKGSIKDTAMVRDLYAQLSECWRDM